MKTYVFTYLGITTPVAIELNEADVQAAMSGDEPKQMEIVQIVRSQTNIQLINFPDIRVMVNKTST